jgi:Cu(I)/Ag(I) efflux system membrane fusion protein
MKMKKSIADLAVKAGALAAGILGGILLHGQVAGRQAREQATPSPSGKILPTQPGELADLTPGPRALELARKKTETVRFRRLQRNLHFPATLEVDERRLKSVTARVGGRIEALFANAAGVPIEAGQAVARLYSPTLEAAQKEYLAARRNVTEGAEESMAWAKSALAAARTKLRLYGLSVDQIEEIAKRGAAKESMEILSPMGGTVLSLGVREGAYVKEGDVIARIADLSRLWASVWVHEEDLFWIQPGGMVEFEAKSGETYHGRIAFIDPVVGPNRAVRARIDVGNEEGKLKPGLFARAKIRTHLPGTDGYGGKKVLSVSRSAVITAGIRRLVFLRKPTGKFALWDVTVGVPGDRYVPILSGLEEMDEVASDGNLELDSEQRLPFPGKDAPAFLVTQENCPVMGGKIDRKVFVDHRGKRIFFCCPSCERDFLAEPERYLKVLEELGERPIDTP